MPECPGCGDEFAKGGAFETHVRHCEQVEEESEDSDLSELEDRVEELERQMDNARGIIRDLSFSVGSVDDLEDKVQGNREAITEIVKLLQEQVRHEAEQEFGRSFETYEDVSQFLADEGQVDQAEQGGQQLGQVVEEVMEER